MNVKEINSSNAKMNWFNHGYAALAIIVSLLLGKGINFLIGGLPGSLYGMLTFAVFLALGLFNAKRIQPTIAVILATMGVCFVPAGVGTINYLDMLASHGLVIVLMIVVTTLLVITVVGLLTKSFVSTKVSK